MRLLSDDELRKITDLFSFGEFRAAAICNSEAESLYNAFQKVAKTEIGSYLLRNIYECDEDTRIRLDRCYTPGYGGSVNSVCDENGKIKYQKVELTVDNEKQMEWCLVHELTHVLQRRMQGCLSSPEKRFIIDRLGEAEARLNTTKYIYEVMKNSDIRTSQELYSSIRAQERLDLTRYKWALSNKRNEAEINSYMLHHIYNDAQWIKDYHQQNVMVANHPPKEGVIIVPYSTVVDKIQGRLHLVNSNLPEHADISIQPFLNIKNMSDYNPDEIVYNKDSSDYEVTPITRPQDRTQHTL